METLRVIQGGYSCDAGLTPDGWFAGVKVIEDFDARYLAECGRQTVTFREGVSEEKWSDEFCSAPRKLILVGDLAGREVCETLAEADRIDGPATADGPRPAVAWIEKAGGTYRLMLRTPEGTQCVLESEKPRRAPALAWAGGEALLACEYAERGRSFVEVRKVSGESLHTTEGSRPRLVSAGPGRLVLIVERCNGPQSFVLAACECFVGGPAREVPLPPADDYNLNADLVVEPLDGTVYAVWESCPAWGYDERVGLHRTLSLWYLSDGGSTFQPAPGTANGFLPVRHEAYLDGTMHNYVPIHPRVMLIDGEPAVAWRRFRFTGVKGFGWDTFLTRMVDGRWTSPERVSANEGPQDSRYAIRSRGEELLGFFPCSDNRRSRTFEEEAAGDPGSGRTGYANNHRVEISRFGVNESHPDLAVPHWKRGVYVVNPGLEKVAPDPLPLDGEPEGLALIWGDLHAHSSYSKCMSGNDGTPQDVLRFERDTLGCKVLCLTEHVEYLSSPEFTHVLDTVESECGEDCIPFFGVEWAKKPAHHTNFFAIDREIFDRLRALMLVCDHLTPLYERIRQELPAGSVVAIRHMHGMSSDDFGVSGPRVTETHEPATEWAMESMQTRGNMMVAPCGKVPPFPNNFLNSGARLGLIGGSDHSRGGGPNRFCLTGFWVPEITPRAAFDAIRNRKTVGVANGKVAMWPTLGGKPMGESLTAEGPVRIQVRLSCATSILRACLMRDGTLLDWQEIGAPVAQVELMDNDPPAGSHWYSVTVEAQSAFERPPILAHASPFFVEVE